jgi:hypothetical protein
VSYTAPQREILVNPYVSFLYAKDLYADFADDQFGIGAGLMIRTQIHGGLGYFLDASYNKLDVNSSPQTEGKGIDAAVLITGGIYYAYEAEFGRFRLDLGYGAVTAGNNAMTIFIPGVEFSKEFYNRISYTAKIGYLITNDWFTDLGLKEKYTSAALSAGIAVVF